MERTLGSALIIAIAWTISFYAARGFLQGVIFLISRSVPRPAPRHVDGASRITLVPVLLELRVQAERNVMN